MPASQHEALSEHHSEDVPRRARAPSECRCRACAATPDATSRRRCRPSQAEAANPANAVSMITSPFTRTRPQLTDDRDLICVQRERAPHDVGICRIVWSRVRDSNRDSRRAGHLIVYGEQSPMSGWAPSIVNRLADVRSTSRRTGSSPPVIVLVPPWTMAMSSNERFCALTSRKWPGDGQSWKMPMPGTGSRSGRAAQDPGRAAAAATARQRR